MKKLFITLGFVATTIVATATVRYVTTNGSSSSNGLGSWSNASNDLQKMINNSVSGDTVFVAKGTYVPIRPLSEP